jgi:hypothetical protein
MTVFLAWMWCACIEASVPILRVLPRHATVAASIVVHLQKLSVVCHA